jgi:hypothetical protein
MGKRINKRSFEALLEKLSSADTLYWESEYEPGVSQVFVVKNKKLTLGFVRFTLDPENRKKMGLIFRNEEAEIALFFELEEKEWKKKKEVLRSHEPLKCIREGTYHVELSAMFLNGEPTDLLLLC